MKAFYTFIISLIILFSPLNSYSQLIWSTFLGGNDDESESGLIIDSAGNPIIAGTTSSMNFPATIGAYKYIPDTVYACFVSKFYSEGSKLIFSTFIGQASCMALSNDKFGNLFLTGETRSHDFPTTSNAFQNKAPDKYGSSDAFVSKLNKSGSVLLFSTYLGGVDWYDTGIGIAVDSSDNSYITGQTTSIDFPYTTGAYDTISNIIYGYSYPGFVSKLNSQGSNLVYSTFIGGKYRNIPCSIAVDSINNAIITGFTLSSDFPVTFNAFDTIYNGSEDIFVTKFNNEGSSLLYSSFIGGSKGDVGHSIIFDNEDNAYITGSTESIDYPVTPGAYDTNLILHIPNPVITKINLSSNTLFYSSFIGEGYGTCIVIDSERNIYISGITFSDSFPVTHNCFDSVYNGGENDCFISELNSEGDKLLYSTYLGGDKTECDSGKIWHGGMSYLDPKIVLDNLDNIIISGVTWSENFPTTNNAYNTKINGQQDVFITKLDLCSGRGNLQAVNEMKFPIGGICNYQSVMTDTIYLRNTGDCKLYLHGLSLTGIDSSLFSAFSNNIFPFNIQPGDSVPIIVIFNPDSSFDDKSAVLNIFNSTPSSPYIINLTGKKDSIELKVNSESSDTIIIDLGTYCPGDAIKDTTITIFNKSSIGTTFKIENVDPGLQLNVKDKAEKKEGEEPKKKK